MTSKNLKVAIWLVLAVSAVAVAKGPGGGSPGTGGGGGGGGPPTTEVSNNLAFPIFGLTGLSPNADILWSVPDGTLGTNYVYGCAVPDGDFLTSACLNGTVPMSKDACATFCGVTSDEVFRIYKQKVPTQTWRSEVITPAEGLPNPAEVGLIDWGDALESRTSAATSKVRVEAMPFFDIRGVNGARTLTGIEMWHVSGTGVDEMWGARATDEAAPQPFPYETPYAIMNAGVTTLHLAKLSGPVTCPTQPSVTGSSPYDGIGSDNPDDVIAIWGGLEAGWGAGSTLFQDSEAYSAELNIQGKYVYGYNWDLKSYDTGGVAKAGWWRLTFVANGLDFTNATRVEVPIVPPAVPSTEPPTEAEGRLYVPVVREDVDLTFIDVCIASAKGGGGNSRKPPNPGEGE